MSETLVARITKKPNTKFVETDRLIDWISLEKDAEGQPAVCRVPEPQKHTFSAQPGFVTAGLPYPAAKALTAVPVDRENGLFRDMYGRKVLLVKERFPCFDSSDFLYENRYYRWAYFVSKEMLICVYWEDQGRRTEVTEDVRVVPELSWEAMTKAGLIREDILLL